jgi:hypothetical protein
MVSGAVGLEQRSAGEAAFLVEMVGDEGVDGGEHLHIPHPSEAEQRPLQSSELHALQTSAHARPELAAVLYDRRTGPEAIIVRSARRASAQTDCRKNEGDAPQSRASLGRRHWLLSVDYHPPLAGPERRPSLGREPVRLHPEPHGHGVDRRAGAKCLGHGLRLHHVRPAPMPGGVDHHAERSKKRIRSAHCETRSLSCDRERLALADTARKVGPKLRLWTLQTPHQSNFKRVYDFSRANRLPEKSGDRLHHRPV